MSDKAGRGERRSEARDAAWMDPGLRAELPCELMTAGWTVRPWTIGAAGPPGFGLAVVGGSGPALDAAIAAAEAWRRVGAACVAILCGASSAEQLGRAAEVTPFVYDLALPARLLARLLTAGAEIAGRARRSGRISDCVPTLRIELGISVELDGDACAFGLAERNFLYLLAVEDGAILSKDHLVEAGPRRVLARECRRRLGKRLGWETASLLVPESRGEPYRMRTKAELDRIGRLRLCIKGRAGVRTVAFPDMDRLPEE